MKMFYVLIVLMQSLIPYCQSAQEDFIFGDVGQLINYDIKIIGVADNKIVKAGGYGLGSTENYVQIFDPTNAKLLNEFKLKYKIDGKKVTILEVFIFNGKVSTISTIIKKKDQKQLYFFHNITEHGDFINQKFLAETERYSYLSAENANNTVSSALSFNYVISEDRKQLAYLFRDETAKNGSKFKTFLLDQNLNLTQDQIIDIPKNRLVDYRKSLLSNEGQLYLLSFLPILNSKDDFKKMIRLNQPAKIELLSEGYSRWGYWWPMKYEIYSYDLFKSSKKITIPIDIGNSICSQIKIKLGKQTCTVSGLLSKEKFGYNYGCFIANYELRDGTENFMSTILFDEEIIDEHKDSYEIGSFDKIIKLHDPIINKKGEIFLFAEFVNIYQTESTHNQQSMYTNKFHGKDILISTIGLDGKVIRQSFFHKNQQFSSLDMISFQTIVIQDEIKILYHTSEYNSINQQYKNKKERVNAKLNSLIILSDLNQTENQVIFNEELSELKTVPIVRNCFKNQDYFYLSCRNEGGYTDKYGLCKFKL